MKAPLDDNEVLNFLFILQHPYVMFDNVFAVTLTQLSASVKMSINL